ncbi:hypothetical protein NA56DRAFT_664755 [Hyaloscypha hepaticicola]|uniref:Uncharacterized protein n=1 Tax=Hyaloscypha hepaticicola TaxID=2082293 RepID=A0A2J6PK83_9HELO|nr:hypothetical protein NA56DRAFT_664755 [Hyaloscypha hepaticicola]
MPSRPKYTMRERHNIPELQVLKQAQHIIRQRRGNECKYNIVCEMHFLTRPKHAALRSGQPSQWHLWLAHAETNAKNRMQTSTKLAQIPSSESIFVPSGPFPEDRKGWIGRQAQAGAASHRPRSRSVDVCADAGNWCSLERHKVAMARKEEAVLRTFFAFRAGRAKVPYIDCIRGTCNGHPRETGCCRSENVRRSTHIRDPPQNRGITMKALYQVKAREMQAPVSLQLI